MSQPIVRQIALADWSILRHLRLRALRDSPEAFGSTYDREENMRQESDWHWWIAGEPGESQVRTFAIDGDDELIGMATGMVEDAHPLTAHLFGMWVEPSLRGQGLGEFLLSAVADWASSTGCDAIQLQVVEGNQRAVSFYRREGFDFVPSKREPLREGSSITTRTMVRQLRGAHGIAETP